MTKLRESARRLVGRKSDLGAQVAGLEQAVRAGEGRLDDRVLDPAASVVGRVTARLRLSPDHTVVALAGATGSGKSSTFNALTGLDLASVGVRRPTTAWASACIWGGDGAEEVLDWLEIPPRHRTLRDSMLDTERDKRGNDPLSGLVLVDLPDHDSTEVSHHLEVDRLIVMADLMVWVLDPQKYADAALHHRFLRPLARHRDVMIVVLNHIDEVAPERRAGVLDDVRRLLREDDLEGVPVLATSARTGEGIDELRAMITQRVADKASARHRFRNDVREAAQRLDEATGSAKPRDLSSSTKRELNDAVAEAAGVPVVVDAVQRAAKMRNARATGWPPVTWLSKLRPDPLKRLHLDLGASNRDLIGRARSSVPEATQVQRSRVDSAVRRVADETSDGMTRPWVSAVRRASTSHGDDLADAVDKAVGETPLGVGRTPLWCRAVQVLQWLLMLTVLGGLGWLAAIAVMGYLQMPEPTLPRYQGFAYPTIMVVVGIAVGIVLGLVCRVLVSLGAKARARSADKRMRSAIDGVTRDLVLDPIQQELGAYRTVRDGVDRALR